MGRDFAMPATYWDIKAKTGFSLSTISKYMNGGAVRPKTKQAIDKAVRELDYHPHHFASGLRSKKSKTIGLLIPELSSAFNSTMMSYIAKALRLNGYGCFVCTSESSKTVEEDALIFLLDKMVDGVITIPFDITGRHLHHAESRKIPVVLVDQFIQDVKLDSVSIDNYGSGALAAKYLLDHNHRNMAVISCESQMCTLVERKEGFLAVMRGSPDIVEVTAANTSISIQGGFEAAKSLLSAKSIPTAIFCANYELTLGAVMAINQLGMKYPDDISILGFDNILPAGIMQPALTAITQPMEQIAASATELMLSRLSRANSTIHRVELPVSLVEGKSVRKL